MLERIRHPRVVDFYGIAQVPMRTLLGGGRCVDEGRTRFFLVMEYLERGSIVDNVRRGQYCLKTSFMEHATQVSLSFLSSSLSSSSSVSVLCSVSFPSSSCSLAAAALACVHATVGGSLLVPHSAHIHIRCALFHQRSPRALCSRLHSSPPRLRGSTSAALSIATSSLGTCS